MATIEDNLRQQGAEPLGDAPEPAEGLEFEADYDEDRPIAVLAERQREFQRANRRRYVDVDLPAV